MKKEEERENEKNKKQKTFFPPLFPFSSFRTATTASITRSFQPRTAEDGVFFVFFYGVKKSDVFA